MSFSGELFWLILLNFATPCMYLYTDLYAPMLLACPVRVLVEVRVVARADEHRLPPHVLLVLLAHCQHFFYS